MHPTLMVSICRVRRHRQSPKKERQSDSDAPYTIAKETSIGFVYTIPISQVRRREIVNIELRIVRSDAPYDYSNNIKK